MKKSKCINRILSLVLALTMVVCLMPITASAEVSGEGWYIDGEGALVVTGKLTALPEYGYYSINVLSIGELAFSDSEVWTREVINAGTISGGTFQGTVTNGGTISGGTVSSNMENRGHITGGTFTGTIENAYVGYIEGGTFFGAVTNYGMVTDGTFNTQFLNEYNGIIGGGMFLGIVTNEHIIGGGTFRSAVINNNRITGGTFQNGTLNSERGTIEGGTFSFSVTNQGTITSAKFEGAAVVGTSPISVIHKVDDEDKSLKYGDDLLAELGEAGEGMLWYVGDTAVSGGTVPLCYTEYTLKAHTHNYNYNVSDNIITEVCANDCGHSATATLNTTDATYTGSAITTASVAYSDTWRGDRVDNSAIVYSNNLKVGAATATVTLNGKTATKTFEITAANILGATVTIEPTSATYNGSAHTPTVTVTFNGNTLVQDTDYTLSWDKSGFVNANTYTATIEGKGNFNGQKTAEFCIAPTEIQSTVIDLSQDTFVYDGTAHKPNVTVTFGGKTLTKDQDYELWYISKDRITTWVNGEPANFFGNTDSECITAGEYYVVVLGKGNFAANTNFTYAKFVIEKATVTEPAVPTKQYNGEVQTADVSANNLYTTTENNGGVNAGKYNLVLTLTDSENYKWSTTDTAQVTLEFKITIAPNRWTTTPSITNWTYGETANTPVYEAEFGTVEVTYVGRANDGMLYETTTVPPTKAGNYTAVFWVNTTTNYYGLYQEVQFTVQKADYDMSGAKWDYDSAFDYDGKSHSVWFNEGSLPVGVTVSNYTGNTSSQVGKYTANVSFSYDYNNYNRPNFNTLLEWEIKNDWTPTEYIASTPNSKGWLKDEFEIIAAEGYKISTTNTAESLWENKLTYTGETAGDSVTFYLKNEANGTISLGKTVEYKIDKTAPTGKVEFVGRAMWQEFLNTITFGLFCKDEVTVRITADDNLSGVASIEYCLSDEAMTLDEVKAITDWYRYNGTFGIGPEDSYVIFAKITDNNDNVVYISSDGIVVDGTAPVIIGAEDGKTYYTTREISIIERNIDTITLNGNPVTKNFTLEGNKDATYTIIATDKAGHTTSVTITMKPVADITDVTNENVTPKDKENLEKAKDDLQNALHQNGDNYTDEEKKAIEDEIERIDNALTIIENVKAVESLIKKLPKKVTKKDKDAITAANDAFDALTEYEKSLVDEELKQTLDKACEIFTESSEKAPTKSPQTGESANLSLLAALLFISSGSIITLTIANKKKKQTKKQYHFF